MTTPSEIERKFWDTYGHLDLQPGETLDADDIRGEFTESELRELITLGLVQEEGENGD